jgi:hypothetical protein
MKRKLLFALLVTVFAPALASAQTTIKYTSGPTGSSGTVTASGSYTLACGQTAPSVTLYCVDCSGQGGQVLALVNNKMLTWSATVSCLPSETYLVYARLTTSDFMLNTYINDTPTPNVTVP